MELDKEKLYFKCKGCGGCCGGSPGHVWVTEEEMEKIAIYLQISKKEFERQYVRCTYNRYSLKERTDNYDCIFLQDKRCRIYPVRPEQCKTFPWWPEYLKDNEAWRSLQERCPGSREPELKTDFARTSESQTDPVA